MITKETCVKIYNCYEQIENANELMANLAKIVKEDGEKQRPMLYNAFGERKGLQLGVPSGDSSHYLYDVNTDLGVKIIEAHKKQYEERLVELMAIAKIELAS